jgi:ribosomal protein S18 acetylase RimI-like enzyme
MLKLKRRNMIRPQPATTADVASWLDVVRKVEPLFGPMPDFEANLLHKIGRKAAICVRLDDRDAASPVLGGVILGGTSEHGWIRWLAVRSTARRSGIGQGLVEAAMKRMKPAKTISLDILREEAVAGWPARRLYHRLGFVPGPLTEVGGQPRQRYALTRD